MIVDRAVVDQLVAAHDVRVLPVRAAAGPRAGAARHGRGRRRTRSVRSVLATHEHARSSLQTSKVSQPTRPAQVFDHRVAGRQELAGGGHAGSSTSVTRPSARTTVSSAAAANVVVVGDEGASRGRA